MRHIIPAAAGRFQSSNYQCRGNEPSPGAPVGRWRHASRGPRYLRDLFKGGKSRQRSLLVAGSTVYRGQNNWERSTPNLSGDHVRNNTVNTQGRAGSLWAGAGAGPVPEPLTFCRKSLQSELPLNVFGKLRCLAFAPECCPDTSDLFNCSWWYPYILTPSYTFLSSTFGFYLALPAIPAEFLSS